MIKFFRKIRERLLTENKFNKYLIYAIGEIVLVIIGILIALQINNWNERNKTKTKEIEMLSDFKVSLGEDLVDINRAIKRGEENKFSMELILTHLENDLPYSDSLKFHFGGTTQTWLAQVNRSVFESLKSESLALISNKKLRQELVNLYDRLTIQQKEDADRYIDLLNEASENILITRFNELWKSNHEDWFEGNDFANLDFVIDDLKAEMTPIDFEKLKDDQEYLYFLKSLINRRFWMVEIHHKSVKKSVVKLLNNIEIELEK